MGNQQFYNGWRDHTVEVRNDSINNLYVQGLYTGRSMAYNLAQEEGFMRIPRLVILVSLLLMCVAPIAAQASSAKPASSQAQIGAFIVATESQAQISSSSESSTAEVEREWDRDAARQSFSDLTFRSKVGEEDATCFYIRSYRVTRDDPQSDATRLAGYSTCTPSSRFQTKRAVQLLEIAPR